MGFKPLIHPLDLPEYAGEDFEDDLVVKVISPSIKEGQLINAGRREASGDDPGETSEDYMRRVFGYLAPKIRFWNLEDEQGNRAALPRDVGLDEPDPAKRLALQVDHLYEQDENIVLAVYHAWRMVGLTKKASTDEGKENETPSTPGPDASPQVDLRQLESQIPM